MFENSNLVLYHSISSYQILECIIHKLIYHKEDKALLILPPFIFEKFPDKNVFKVFFEEIYIFPYGQLRDNEDTIQEQVIEAYNHTIPYDIHQFKSIYCAGAHYYFTIYLIYSEVRFSIFEDCPGILSKPDVLREIGQRINHKRFLTTEKFGLYDLDNEFIDKIYCNLNAQSHEYYNQKCIDFQIVDLFLTLPEDEQSEIKLLFNCPDRIDISPNSVLLLTQHFANLKTLSFENHILIYQYLIDFFFSSDQLVIKTHPDDIIYYDILFPNSVVIKDSFPSEFLPLIFNNKPETIATISSTSIDSLVNFFNESFYLGYDYEKDFYHTLKYFTCLVLLDFINTSNIDVKSYQANMPMLNQLSIKNGFTNKIEKVDSLDLLPSSSLIIIDKADFPSKVKKYYHDSESVIEVTEDIISFLRRVDENISVIFLNTLNDFCFFDDTDKTIFDNIIPITIKKAVTRQEDNYCNLKEEVIYFYSKNQELRKLAQNFQFEKELTHTGITMNIDSIDDDELKIKTLEAIISATEKRLLHYINYTKELENEIAKLKK